MHEEIMKKVEEFIRRSDNEEKLSVSECEEFLNTIPSFTYKHTIEDTKDFLAFWATPKRT